MIFLVVSAGFAGISIALAILGFSAEWAFVTFAALMLLWALIYPHLAEPLKSKIVDPWYYSLGLIALLGFYFSASEERGVLQTELQHSVLLDRLARLEVDSAALAQVLNDPEGAFAALKDQLPSVIASTKQAVESAADVPAHWDESQGTRGREQVGAWRDREIADLNRWSAFASEIEFDALKSYDVEQLPSLNEGIQWNGHTYLASRLVHTLKNAVTNAGIVKNEIAALSQQATATQSEIDSTREELDKRRSERRRQNLTPRIVMSFAWPYVAAFLLAMKLARHTIGGSEKGASAADSGSTT